MKYYHQLRLFVLLIGISFALVYDNASTYGQGFVAIKPESLGLPLGYPTTPHSISADGRYVMYYSYTNEIPEVYVFDRQNRTSQKVSVSSAGAPGNAASYPAAISDNGRYIVFYSLASNLISDDTNGLVDAFVHDMETGETRRLSMTEHGQQVDKQTFIDRGLSFLESTLAVAIPVKACISHNSRYIAIQYDLLTDEDSNRIFRGSLTDVYLLDQTTGQITLVSVNSDGTQANSDSTCESISDDGRYILFSSNADNLVVNDTNESIDLFVHDFVTKQTTRVSVRSDGTEGIHGAETVRLGAEADISGDGRYIAFTSRSSLLSEDEPIGVHRVYVHDRNTSQTELVSVQKPFSQIVKAGETPGISADGRFVTWIYSGNVYVRDLYGSNPEGVLLSEAGYIHPTGAVYKTAMGVSNAPSISANGEFVSFYSAGVVYADGTGAQEDADDIYISIVEAQPITNTPTSTVTGQVTDLDGHPLPNVLVTAGSTYQAITDSQGQYALTGLPSGSYKITASLADYFSLDASHDVVVNQDATIPDLVACYSEGLAEQFAPVMRFHESDNYRPIPPSQAMPYAVALVDHDNGIEKLPPISLTTLASDTWRTRPNAYIDFAGDIFNKVVPSSQTPTIFARIYCPKLEKPGSDEERIAMQYWFFYYYDDWTNNHEGDWEMVQIVLTNTQPITKVVPYVAYSQHKLTTEDLPFEGGSKRWREYVEWSGTHPIVYVGDGSHASFFKPFTYYYRAGRDETTPLSSDTVTPAVEMLPVSSAMNSWLYFSGSWGNADYPLLDPDCSRGICGPPGPSQRGQEWDYQWDNPLLWGDNLPWDELAAHQDAGFTPGQMLDAKLRVTSTVPEDVHVYDLFTGDHVGWNNGVIEHNIPNSEYFDSPVSDHRAIIIHELNVLEKEFRFETKRRNRPRNVTYDSSGTTIFDIPDIVIQFPNFQAKTLITAYYDLPTDWNESSVGSVDINSGSTLMLQVDINGDNTVDREIPPSRYIALPPGTNLSSIYLPIVTR